MPTDISVLWLRRDLRLADNPALVAAAAADELLPVYCFDPREYGDRPFGGRDSFRYLKTGPHRVRFRREAVADLRDRLRRRDSDLIVRHGRPERVLPAVVDRVNADTVQFHTFPTPEEMGTEEEVRDVFRNRPVETRRHWGHTLYHVDDLPTRYTRIQDTYTPFRQSVEAAASVRDPLDEPELPPTPGAFSSDGLSAGEIPEPETLEVDPM